MKKEPAPQEEKVTEEMSHDQFAYIVWSNPFVAKLFVKRYLAPKVLREIDLDSLELVTTRHATRKGRNSIGDIYYKFRFKSGKRGVLVVLVEHKARYARFVAIQILRYEVDVLEFMAQNFKLFADENGLLPTPYSILLCPARCPQLEELTSRFEGVEYGPGTRFQTVNFNEVDLDSLSDEPFLQIAMGLCRFAGYSDKKRDQRKDELAKLFDALLKYNPSTKENLREIWDLIFRVSCNYLSHLMRNHDFSVGQFVFNLLDSERESNMEYALYPEIFADMFPKQAQQLQQLQEFQQQIFIANTRADEEHARADEEHAKFEETSAKYEETSAKFEEANSKLKALERILCEKTRKDVYRTLDARRWFDEIPQEITNVLERMTSYARLESVLEAAQNEKSYDDFLKALKKIKR